MKKPKTVAKKPKTRRRKKQVKVVPIIGMNMEQIYVLINLAQTKRENQEVIVDSKICPMIENIFKDCHITYDKDIRNEKTQYTIKPPPEKHVAEETFIFPEDLPDELVEDGFCF